MNDQVTEVKEKVDMVQLVGEYVQLKKAGRNFKGLCPFHGEKSPSFMVNPELQIFKCFGCSQGGDCFAFLQKIEGMEFGEALAHLAKKVGVTLTSYRPNQNESRREKLYQIHDLLALAYHYLLTKHPIGKMALDYAKGRGISEEAIETFKLGYAPERWEFAMEFLTGKKGFKGEEVEQAGLAIPGKSGWYDRFRNRLMFPLANSRGQVVGFAGRVLPEKDNKKEIQQAKYINSPETEIYHKGELLFGFDLTRSQIKVAQAAVVVEGEIDAIASWQAGVKNVVAIKGSALTEKQIELLRRVSENLVMALDADGAGDAAARRGIALAEKMGLTVKVATWEGGKDPGEVAISHPEEWGKIVQSAIPVYDFYLQSAIKRYGTDAVGKRKISAELIPIWAEIPDEIVKAHYIGRLATELGVRDEDVRNQLSKTKVGGGESTKTTDGGKKTEEVTGSGSRSRRELVEEYIVGLALRAHKTELLQEDRVKKLLGEGKWKRIVEKWEGAEAESSVAELVARLPEELKGRVEELFLVEEGVGGQGWQAEWEKAIGELEELQIREQITAGASDTEMVKLAKRLGELTRGK